MITLTRNADLFNKIELSFGGYYDMNTEYVKEKSIKELLEEEIKNQKFKHKYIDNHGVVHTTENKYSINND